MGSDNASQLDPLVELRNVEFSWAGRSEPIISIDKLDIYHRERVFLRGASGAGKTTLLSLITGIIKQQTGTIRVAGCNLEALGSRKKDSFRANRIGLVFQQFNLLPFLSVLENVELGCRFSSQRRKRAIGSAGSLRKEAVRLLMRMQLPEDLLGRSVSTLSVGQQQRVAAARALIGRPALIVADEPTSALDRESQDSFLRLLFEELRDAESTLLFVSHDETLAGRFDRLIDLPAVNRSFSTTRQATD